MKVKVVTWHGSEVEVTGVYEGHATAQQIAKDCLEQFSDGQLTLKVDSERVILVLMDGEETEEYFTIEEFCITMLTS